MINKVSVIIPVYNGEVFIARAIVSVLSQSVKEFEIVVINDGSIDGTLSELDKFRKFIKVITIPNGGVSNARNLGIQVCSGEFVAFLDADDVWYEDKLKIQLEAFERYPEIGFCCCDFLRLNKQINSKVNHFSILKNDKDIVFDQPLKISALEVLFKKNLVGTCSNVMVRKEVLNKVGLFDVNYRQAEDYDLWLRCALETDFLLLSTVLLEKKSHDANLTNDFLETLLCHEQVLINLKSNELAKEKIAKIIPQYQVALALVRYDIGNLYYEADQRTMAFKYFFLGLETGLTANNVKLFVYHLGRKLLRTISFGSIRNRY